MRKFTARTLCFALVSALALALLIVCYTRALLAGLAAGQATLWARRTLIALYAALCAFFAALLYALYRRDKSRRLMRAFAFVDPLTGGRSQLRFTLDAQALLRRRRARWALLVLDIARFTSINDLYGYAYGDALLRDIADALHRQMDASEPWARIAPGRFLALVADNGVQALTARANRIAQSIAHAHADCALTLTGGLYRIAPGDDLTVALDRAATAQRTLQGQHQSGVALYDEAMRARQLIDRALEADMAQSLAHGDFTVLLQPKCRLEDGALCGAEALVRWQHPTYGLLMPDLFIPLFERNGFIVQLDDYVFETVCCTLASWRKDGLAPPIISVNLSRAHLARPDTPARLARCAAKYGVACAHMELELTETLLLQHGAPLASLMQALKHQGFALAMDDFGSGYWSLGQLAQLPVDTIKLDKSFLDTSLAEARGARILSAVIALARQLGMAVLCEGVETRAQAALLARAGCVEAQGYLFDPPLPMETFAEKYLHKKAAAVPQTHV
nr:bifunctional diguanylate cyclase/phosphodiesterase [Maliibacterium massiliense]